MNPALLLSALASVLLFASPAAAQGQAACFFEHAEFQGRRVCFGVGQRVPFVEGMNDRFSSVQVPPGVRVTICEHINFGGRCIPIDRTVRNFVEINFNDKVSSVIVEGDRGGPPRGPQMGGPQMGGPRMGGRYDDARSEMWELREACDAGDRRSCIRFGIAIGRNWERRERWRDESPEFFNWER